MSVWFINKSLTQHVSGTIVPIFRTARLYTTAYGFQHLIIIVASSWSHKSFHKFFSLSKCISWISRGVSLCFHVNTVLQKVNHIMRQCVVYAVYILWLVRYFFLITILYNDQQMHNYVTNYPTPTCFDTTVSSSGSGVPRVGGFGGFKPAPPHCNSEGPPKSCQTQPDCENC